MADTRVKSLIQQGDHLFSKRITLMSLWQEIAENFYVERADFTVTRNLGVDFAANLMTSIPPMVRRDLGNTFSTMLRPSDEIWFEGRAEDDANNEIQDADNDSLRWLQWMSGVMRRAMYDRKSQFVRATKEADHDFAAFGQAVLSVEVNRRDNTMLYRCWHLRDVAWCENAYGEIDTVHRKWKPTARELVNVFGASRVHAKVLKLLNENDGKNAYTEINCRHMLIPADMYDFSDDEKDRFGLGKLTRAGRRDAPFVSIYIDVDNQHIMEATPQWVFTYVIPRWQTVSGSQYSFSPATTIALPEARLMQSVTLTLLEAGEKAVNPPLIGVAEALRGDLDIRAGGFTAVDSEYDERLGEVLRPLTQSAAGNLNFGVALQQQLVQTLKEAFFINKIQLPPIEQNMTAFEVGQRVQEYVRQALPIFEPAEQEYNTRVCDVTFDLMMREGAFGSYGMIPPALRGKNVRFKFTNPLTETSERAKGQKFLEAVQLVAQAASADPGAAQIVDVRAALRDSLNNIIPAKWMRSDDDMKQIEAQQAQQQQEQQMLAQLQQGAQTAQMVGDAGQSLVKMQNPQVM